MVWQTQRDAMDVAGMYEGLSNRNKQISEYEKLINLNDKQKDPLVKQATLKAFRDKLTQAQFDTENNILQGLDVNAPNIVNDFDYGKWAMENAGQWKPDTFGGKNVKTISTKAGDKLPDGTISGGGLYKLIGNHVTEKVSKQEIMQGLNKMAQEHPELQATLQRDMQVYGPEATMAKLNQTFNAAADAHAYTRQLANEDSVIFDPASTNAYNKVNSNDPLASNTYTPNDIFQEYKTAGKLEFPDLLNSSLQNNKKSKATLLSALDNMVQNGNPNAKKAKEVVKGLSELSEEYPEYADIIRRSTAGQFNSSIGRIGQAMFNVGSHINNLINTGTGRSEDVIKKGQKLVDQYKELARTGIFDSKFENEFEAATNTTPLTRKLPINSVNLESDAVRTAITKLSNDLNLNKFDILEGEWKNPEDIKVNITGVSKEPYGAGSGIAFELMDSKGNTVIATPKKQAAQGIIGELDKVLPGIRYANNYREMVPLSYSGQQKDFADIGEEIGNIELSKQFKGYKLVLNEDGTYTRISPNGEKVNSPNPILLLPQM
jgi:polyhydroxyalkanoate synthesis regulator phasin